MKRGNRSTPLRSPAHSDHEAKRVAQQVLNEIAGVCAGARAGGYGPHRCRQLVKAMWRAVHPGPVVIVAGRPPESMGPVLCVLGREHIASLPVDSAAEGAMRGALLRLIDGESEDDVAPWLSERLATVPASRVPDFLRRLATTVGTGLTAVVDTTPRTEGSGAVLARWTGKRWRWDDDALLAWVDRAQVEDPAASDVTLAQRLAAALGCSPQAARPAIQRARARRRRIKDKQRRRNAGIL